MTNPTQPAEGMPEPLACPFCGHVGLSFSDGSTYRWGIASCDGCGASAGDTRREYPDTGKWHAEAIKQWNTSAAPKAPPMPSDVYDVMLSTIGAASMYLSREQMKPFIDWLKVHGFTKE